MAVCFGRRGYVLGRGLRNTLFVDAGSADHLSSFGKQLIHPRRFSPMDVGSSSTNHRIGYLVGMPPTQGFLGIVAIAWRLCPALLCGVRTRTQSSWVGILGRMADT